MRKNMRALAANARAEAPLKLWSIRDIARLTGVTVPTVRKWRARYEDFPEPVAVINGFQLIFDEAEVNRWYTRHLIRRDQRFSKAKRS